MVAWFLLISAAVGLVIIVDTIRLGIGPMPSTRKAVSACLELCDEAPRHRRIAELGSGWGTLAVALARKYPGSSVVAYEAALVPYMFQRFRLFLLPVENLTIKQGNFLDSDLAGYDLLVCYLYPGAMEALGRRFRCELQKESAVVSHTFRLPGWEPRKIVYCKDIYNTPVYLYVQFF